MTNTIFHDIHQKSRLSMKEVNEALKEFGLYSAQWSLLFCLNRLGSMTQTEIWQYLNVEAPTVTRTLVKLEERKLIIRKEGKDKRERIVQLTEHAKDLIPRIETRIEKLEQTMLQALSEEERIQLAFLLNKISGSGETDGIK
ncbi:MarR family winged helix-turn-helix transcriptional regulator [Paenisporosarcina indica]|uniref:MarR family winged helix-turn-helix transcriptional regulator n=1 Tax=Paenisporosarcina indica TaxID=650093 RepID=UPI00094FA516|nr:MarR family transcriptional regulator [Paenisporosarcina indica]